MPPFMAGCRCLSALLLSVEKLHSAKMTTAIETSGQLSLEDRMTTARVAYIYDKSIGKELNKVEQIEKRSEMVNQLVFSYRLHCKMMVVKGAPATDEEVTSFHSQEYLNFLKSVNKSQDLEKHEEDQLEYGLGYDCPLIEGIYDFVRAVAGSSITAAKLLTKGVANVAVNWYGGWHHAQRDEAEGFCYVNDIVCAVHILTKKFNRVLYIDLDVHHGNGVENAFAFTDKVMTVSFHHYAPGFYPASGSLSDVGFGKGRFYTVNVPLKSGIGDKKYAALFNRVSEEVFNAFKPEAVVVQCGADCLTGDPLGTFNVTPKCVGHCVRQVLSWGVPALFLGGGGYNLTNAARCWAYLTSVITECEISTEIPDNLYFTKYGPDFVLEITPSNRADENSDKYIEDCLKTISGEAMTYKTNALRKPFWK